MLSKRSEHHGNLINSDIQYYMKLDLKVIRHQNHGYYAKWLLNIVLWEATQWGENERTVSSPTQSRYWLFFLKNSKWIFCPTGFWCIQILQWQHNTQTNKKINPHKVSLWKAHKTLQQTEIIEHVENRNFPINWALNRVT